MAFELKPWLSVPVFLLLLVSKLHACEKPQVPCYFIFGDSLSDTGNNNDIVIKAKVNYFPYGIDFPEGPTGRFSNARNIQDVLVELLGFKHYIPPFATAKGAGILKGVNYASGAAGIRKESGRHLGAPISMDMQLKNHQTTISNIVKILGNDRSLAAKHLSKCIYSVYIGTNDYINNYFLPEYYSTSRKYTLEKYTKRLIHQYSKQIKTLYNDGARKFALFSLGQIGCAPYQVATKGTNGSSCVESLDRAAQLFNQRLLSLVKDSNSTLKGAKVTYIDASLSTTNLMSLGFTNFNSSCCETAILKSELCIRDSKKTCPDRSMYVFWDGVHPTDALSSVMARNAYGAHSNTSAYPFNIETLARL